MACLLQVVGQQDCWRHYRRPALPRATDFPACRAAPALPWRELRRGIDVHIKICLYLDEMAMAQFSHLLEGLRAAGESPRLRLVALLAEGELTVGEIADVLGQSQPRVSRHLRLLAEGGLIERLPEGAWVFYRLAHDGDGGRLVHTLLSLLPLHDPRLERDRRRLSIIRARRARM